MVANKLFIFGLGYVGQHLGTDLLNKGWYVAGTTRTITQAQRLARLGFQAIVWDGVSDFSSQSLEAFPYVMVTIPPDEKGDIVLKYVDLSSRPLNWIGYLSATSVYGDHQGAWVDENTTVNPTTARGHQRLLGEKQWLALHAQNPAFPIHIFRLSGIYGPGRSIFDSLRAGTAQRIDKPGHVFSRIHIEDIVISLEASMANPHPGEIYNLADDEPASTSDLIAYGCQLMCIGSPPIVPFEKARISEALREFYSENKRVSNHKIKESLGVSLRYPTYREGLRHC